MHPFIEYVHLIDSICARRRTGEITERDDALMDRLEELWEQLTEEEEQLIYKICWRGFPEEVDSPEHAWPEYIDLDPEVHGVPRLRIK